MKKLTALMLAALMLLAIGCTAANDVEPANETQPTAAVEQPTAVPTDEPVSDHDRAMELIQTGDYEAAYALLEQIGEPEAIAANKYDRAQALIETGNYEAAYALLDGLEYKDSEELFGNVKFQLQKNSISIAEEGDYITFGAYEQDNDLSNGKEDIEWLVLAKDEDKLLAISRYILDCGPYNSSEEDVLWRDCSLRTWLNNEFYHAAFDADQQEMIAVSDAKDGNNPFFEDPIEEIYVDHVFLLGPFGFQFEKKFQMSPQRRPQKTAYAKAQGAMEELWWLKSSCSGDEYYYNSLTENDMMYDYFPKGIIGIRPVIWINIEESTVSETVAAEKYNSAVALIKVGNYKDAYTLLNGLNYKDSTDLLAFVKSTLLSLAKTGDYIFFGKYEQDNDFFNGKEDIEWLVLDKTEDKILVISRFALDSQPYNTVGTDVTWETCSLRAWLNNTFLKNAFNSEEQELIVETTVQPAEKNSLSNRSEGNATTDRIFLLNFEETNRYFISNAEKVCEMTSYTEKLSGIGGLLEFNHSFANWWVRTPGDKGSECTVGYWNFDYPVDSNVCGTRPAMWIKIDTIVSDDMPTGQEAETTETLEDAIIPAELIGTWAGGDESYLVGTYEFYEDGTGVYSHANGFVLNFTYAVENGKIHFQYEGCVSQAIRLYRIEGDSLMIANKNGYDQIYLKK